MEHVNSGPELPAAEALDWLNVERASLLRRIDALEQGPSIDTKRDEISQLRKEYNFLVEEHSNMTRQTYRDPLQVLPPELWKDLMPSDIDELLPLTMVSSLWFNALTSIPFLWTDIALDSSIEDSLSKAITCLNLSRPIEFDLRIEISLGDWEGVASHFTSESSRIRSLQIHYLDEARLPESLKIVSSFTELSSLRRISLPYRNWIFILGDDPQLGLDPGVFERIPAPVEAMPFPFTAEILGSPRFSKLQTVNIRQIDAEIINTLARLPDLKRLFLSQGVEPRPEMKDDMRDLMPACLSSISELYYWGLTSNWYSPPLYALAFEQALLYTGNNLTKVSAGPINLYHISNLLMSLHRFPKLHDLQLDIDNENESEPKYDLDSYVSSSLPIRRLKLFFRYLPFNTAENENREQMARRHERAFKHLFCSFFTSMSLLEELTVEGDCMLQCAMEYTRDLQNLQSLTVPINFKRSLRFPSSHDSSFSLQDLWSLYAPPTNLFTDIPHQTLRYLQISTCPPSYLSFPSTDGIFPVRDVVCPRYDLSPTEIPILATLYLQLDHPLMVDFTMLCGLKTIVLKGNPSATFASDFFEELLLQPNKWPLLQSIIVRGEYAEWDILILMLQRRNFVTNPNVKRIKHLQFDEPLPYKILQPITWLLKGQFPESVSLSDFSIEESGNIICNLDIAGCRSCILGFRACMVPVRSKGQDSVHDFNIDNDIQYMMSWKYQLPHQFIEADPPLAPHHYLWLSGKQERRMRLLDRLRDSIDSSPRMPSCKPIGTRESDQFETMKYISRHSKPVTVCSMDGANFQEI